MFTSIDPFLPACFHSDFHPYLHIYVTSIILPGRKATHMQIRETSQLLSDTGATLQELVESESEEGLGRRYCNEDPPKY